MPRVLHRRHHIRDRGTDPFRPICRVPLGVTRRFSTAGYGGTSHNPDAVVQIDTTGIDRIGGVLDND